MAAGIRALLTARHGQDDVTLTTQEDMLARLSVVLEAGARGICVVSAILNARDVAAACRKYKDQLSTVDSGS